jgi:hypothetical protein
LCSNASATIHIFSTQTVSILTRTCLSYVNEDAVRKEQREQLATNDCGRDIAGDSNELWQKRGNISLSNVVIATRTVSGAGKVLVVAIL